MGLLDQLGLDESTQKELADLGFDGDESSATDIDVTASDKEVDNQTEPGIDDEAEVEAADPTAPEDEDAEESEESTEDSEDDAIEVFTTKDGKKITIDYGDRDKVKRAYMLARQGRQWQSELNVIKKQFEDVNEKYQQINEVWGALEDNKDDPAELYRLFTGGEDWEEMIQREIQHRNELSKLTPDQLEVYKQNKLLERREKQLALREERIQKEREASEAATRNAAADTQKAQITSAFNEYNFTGQLGDPRREHRLNRTTWNNIKAELSSYDNLDESVIRDVIKQQFDDIRNEIGFIEKKVATKKRKKQVASATKQAASVATPNKLEDMKFDGDNLSNLLANLDNLEF